jgi:hypothetical protein
MRSTARPSTHVGIVRQSEIAEFRREAMGTVCNVRETRVPEGRVVAEIEYLELRQEWQNVFGQAFQILVYQVRSVQRQVYQVDELALVAGATESVCPCFVDSVA